MDEKSSRGLSSRVDGGETYMRVRLRYSPCLFSNSLLCTLLFFSFLWAECIQRSIAMHNSHNTTSNTFEAGQGVSLYYEVSGKCDAGKWILLVHGFGASSED